MTTSETLRLTIRAALIMKLASELVDCKDKIHARLALQDLTRLVDETRVETAQIRENNP